MSQAAKDLMALFVDWYYPDGAASTSIKDYITRDLVCTPFGGNYGTIAGWVVCVNGSPPKGTLIILGKGPQNDATYYLGAESRRVLRKKHIKVVTTFYDTHLKDRVRAFTIGMRPFPGGRT